MNAIPAEEKANNRLDKCLTGIQGLDEVLEGGLPCGRPTLICGGAGCGKTMLACEFLIRGIQQHGEPGVFMAFEETQEDLAKNLASLDIDLENLIEQGKIFVDFVHIDRDEIEETGQYDLEGLFIRLASAIDAVGAERVVLDTIESIFTGFSNKAILRSELRRLFRWLKAKGVTAVVTSERGANTLTRHGLEEYVSDCVIQLDHRVQNGIATRFMRVVKYRGSTHSSDEYPFLIDRDGIWVMPVTSINLDYQVSREYISSGIPALDAMLDGKGYYRGSSILLSGTAGTGKTSLAAHLVDAACRRGERCLFFAYEESSDQIIRNMCSIGIDLNKWVEKGLMHFHTIRPSLYGIEMHLLTSHKLTEKIQPDVVVFDPISNFTEISTQAEAKTLLVRLIDSFKSKNITTLFTNLTQGGEADESTNVGISSLMDVWLLLKSLEGKWGAQPRLVCSQITRDC
jgi:circadian clock protein KaiC